LLRQHDAVIESWTVAVLRPEGVLVYREASHSA